MQFAVQQALTSSPNPLAAICFGLGIVALLFVFRRMIARRRNGPAPLAELETLFASAHHQVLQITEREQYHKLHTGYKFYRRGESARQSAHALARLARQHAHGAERHG